MENHGLRTHNDKVCADSSTGNTPNTPQLFGISYKKAHITFPLSMVKGIHS